jgi:hypothetical protein
MEDRIRACKRKRIIYNINLFDDAGYGTGGGVHYVIDNFTYNVPEPTSLLLFALGGLLIRKRKSLIVQVEFGKIISIERTELCFVNV